MVAYKLIKMCWVSSIPGCFLSPNISWKHVTFRIKYSHTLSEKEKLSKQFWGSLRFYSLLQNKNQTVCWQDEVLQPGANRSIKPQLCVAICVCVCLNVCVAVWSCCGCCCCCYLHHLPSSPPFTGLINKTASAAPSDPLPGSLSSSDQILMCDTELAH